MYALAGETLFLPRPCLGAALGRWNPKVHSNQGFLLKGSVETGKESLKEEIVRFNRLAK